jgi:hypothetical protein
MKPMLFKQTIVINSCLLEALARNQSPQNLVFYCLSTIIGQSFHRRKPEFLIKTIDFANGI